MNSDDNKTFDGFMKQKEINTRKEKQFKLCT